ncbi:GDP-mannose 4,6-dehydratase [candidate division KSB1 bacterium]|nr:GDP-mannose 4,6-dehydratase [candidate division KSB1 bacterium]
MKFLITGGAGFIGSHLIERLLADGHDIVCIDNFNDYYDPKIKRRNLSTIEPDKAFRLIDGDILDEPLLDAIFCENKFDAIVHLAARAGVRPSVEQPKLYQEVNIRGTMNLLDLAKEHGIKKFVMASSSSVYGNNKKVPFSELDFVDNPISPYAATKKACELIGYTYHALYDMSVSCLRFFTVYGPRQRPDMAIHKFTVQIDQDRPIYIYGDGSAKRDFTFITDIIDGIVASIERCDGYNVYNLGESRVVELMYLVQLIEQGLGKRAKIIKTDPQPGDVAITYADISKAKSELDYSPSVAIERGIEKFIEWYKNNK